MSTVSRHWRLRRDRLAEALGLWLSSGPTHRDRRLVHDFVMDLVVDPFACGVQDGDTGVFVGKASRKITVLYVPHLEAREVSVILIAYDA